MVRRIDQMFGEYLPDLPVFNNPGCVEAFNTYPSPSGFDQFEGPFVTGDTVSEPTQGGALFYRSDGSALEVAGGSTTLVTRLSGSITETTGYVALSPEQRWRFARHASYVIAVSLLNDPQYLPDVDVDISFVDLPGSPPKANVIGVVGDFVILGDLAGFPYRIQWGNFNNPTGIWDTNVGDLSGFRDMDAAYGKVTGIVPIASTAGLVFQERAIWLLNFVGAPLVFKPDPVSKDNGCVAPDSIVSVGSNVYFVGQDGFYFTNGAEIGRIGANRVDKTFLASINESYESLYQAAVHWDKQSIIWSYNTIDPIKYQNQFIYSFASDSWARSGVDLYTMVAAKQDDQTLDSLTTLYGTIAGMPFAIGSDNYKGKAQVLSAFADDGAGGSDFVTFTGDTLQADIRTGVRQIATGRRSTVTGAAPLIENLDESTLTQILVQNNLTAISGSSTPTTAGVDGYCPHHIDGRYVSTRMTVPATAVWSKAMGVQVRARPSGYR